MITFSMNKPSTRRKPEHSTVHCRDLCGGSTTGLRHVLSAMPELAEVEGIVSNGIPLVATKLSISACIRGTAFFAERTRALFRRILSVKSCWIRAYAVNEC